MPAGADRDEEGLAVGGLVFEKFFQERGIGDVGEVLLAELFALAVEFVRKALEEQHPEDEFLELGRIHLAAQNVGGFEEEAFELRKGDFCLFHVSKHHKCTAQGEFGRSDQRR